MHSRELNVGHFPFCQILIAAVILSIIQHFPQVDITAHCVQPQNSCLHLNGQFQRSKLLVK